MKVVLKRRKTYLVNHFDDHSIDISKIKGISVLCIAFEGSKVKKENEYEKLFSIIPRKEKSSKAKSLFEIQNHLLELLVSF